MYSTKVLFFDGSKVEPIIEQIELPPECQGIIGWKWTGGVVGGDGMVYCIPGTATKVLQIDPIGKTCCLVGDEVINTGCGDDEVKFCGGVLSPFDGVI